MKPLRDMTEAELVSDEGLDALDRDVADPWAPHLTEYVPALTAEIRRLRDHVHEIAQEIAERLVEEDDEDDFAPGPPVYGPLTLMEQLTRDLSRDLAEQLYAWRPVHETRMVGLAASSWGDDEGRGPEKKAEEVCHRCGTAYCLADRRAMMEDPPPRFDPFAGFEPLADGEEIEDEP